MYCCGFYLIPRVLFVLVLVSNLNLPSLSVCVLCVSCVIY